MDINSTETGTLPIPFSRSFVNFWMGWWILVYMILLLTVWFSGVIGWITSEICFFIWIIQAIRIFDHNMDIEGWRWDNRFILVLIPLGLNIYAMRIYVSVFANSILEDIKLGNFSDIGIAFFVYKAFALLIIPVFTFIYTKWYLNKHGHYLEDIDFAD